MRFSILILFLGWQNVIKCQYQDTLTYGLIRYDKKTKELYYPEHPFQFNFIVECENKKIDSSSFCLVKWKSNTFEGEIALFINSRQLILRNMDAKCSSSRLYWIINFDYLLFKPIIDVLKKEPQIFTVNDSLSKSKIFYFNNIILEKEIESGDYGFESIEDSRFYEDQFKTILYENFKNVLNVINSKFPDSNQQIGIPSRDDFLANKPVRIINYSVFNSLVGKNNCCD